MNTFDKNMEKIFDVEPVEKESKPLPIATVNYNEPDMKQDLTDAYQQSKENLQELIDQGYLVKPELHQILVKGGDVKDTAALVLSTLSEGALMNNTGSEDISGSLASGSSDNIRWQVANSDTAQGTFSLIIRQGNDNTDNPIVLETWTNLSMDPTLPNFVTKSVSPATTVGSSIGPQRNRPAIAPVDVATEGTIVVRSISDTFTPGLS